MIDEAEEMYERWSKHTEGACPQCEDGDTIGHQEVSHIWLRSDTRPETMSTDMDELLLVESKCSDCDWKGYLAYEVGPFRGNITDDEIERHEDMALAKLEARSSADLCFLHEAKDCEEPECVAPPPTAESMAAVTKFLKGMVARLTKTGEEE